MALKITVLALLHLFLVLFIARFGASHAVASDVECLKSIKASLEDPFGYFNSSWNFNDNTEGFICRFRGVDCWHPDENKVFNLRLSDMGLKGNFPRGLGNCTSLTGLDLSNNKLNGTIPADIGNLLPFLTSLDLSSNHFSGEIPKSLANCNYLNILKLDNNRLTGNLPKELCLLERLKEFSVSNNLLSGPVPDFPGGEITKDSYVNNPQLCGGPLEPCSTKFGAESTFKIGFAIGYAVSAAAVFISFSCSWLQLKNTLKILILYKLQKRLRRKEEADQPSLKHNDEILGLERLVNRISFEDLCRATGNFSADNVIGRGKTGTMYKATLQNGLFLGVKKLCDSGQFESQFVTELLALARLKHDNIIPLLGLCTERNQMILVYKYMSNGNLHDWLHGEPKILEWPLRLKIAIGIARGLSWLHHKCNFRVVHREISSKSILLDHHFEPKISNFGKTIISNQGGAMFKYADDNDSGFLMNSEVWESDFVKEDVFKFGIVLLELLAWKEANNAGSSPSSLHNSLMEWINHVSISPRSLDDAIDKSLSGQGYDDEVMEVLGIAAECVQPLPNQRPTMLQVHRRISSLGERYGFTPCDSGYCSNQDTPNTGDEISPVEQTL
ncbi:hypothetical protein TIFTF001_005822 [Ficus carica]|uniref:Protein kinase domain-containing protein n=1 Tax=Ficus carica TaxID=3494 RepID=A0AA87ZG05_FICCA|nr:hypothetical protein TIFTF001_005822 [Ficus carica]